LPVTTVKEKQILLSNVLKEVVVLQSELRVQTLVEQTNPKRHKVEADLVKAD